MDTVQAKAAAPASALALAICLCPLLVSAELLKRPLSLADRTHRIPPKHGGASETSLAAPELFTAVRCRSPLITHSLTLLLSPACLFSLFPQFHPPHHTTDPSQIPQRWATTRPTPWRSTPSALSRYVWTDNLNGWPPAASPSLSHHHQHAR
jgi:hypothetical protein